MVKFKCILSPFTGVVLLLNINPVKNVLAQPAETADCLNGVEFLVINELVTFDTAKARCEERNAKLARITNQTENTFVFGLCDELLDTDDRVWIGN